MKKKKQKYMAWMIDAETACEIIELAQAHGKKAGENMQKEFEEILKHKKNKFKLLGTTDKDLDLLVGELRENGKRILNLKELDRRKKKR